ncbi:MAG: ATPase, T2SS/T4P/T4SS family [Deltaproteobacteria bacterium]|nr:ATPase, T2SS/T4P/T4SS family [Deltaproteobacteria bacterium]
MIVANERTQPVTATPPSRVHIPPEAIRDYLMANPLFAGLTGDVLLPLCQQIIGLEALPRAVLVAAGAAVDGMGMVLAGRAKVEVPFNNGGSFTIDVLHPGATFGSVGLLASSLSPVQVIAEEATKALWLPQDVVAALFAVAPRFADCLAREVANQLVRVCALPRNGAPAAPSNDVAVIDALDLLEAAPIGGPGTAPRAAPAVVPARLAPGQIAFVDVVEADITPTIASLLPGRLIRGQRVLPLRLVDNVLSIAAVAPKSTAAIEAVRALYPQCKLDVSACAADDFEKVCARLRLDDTRVFEGGKTKERTPGRGAVGPDSLAYEDPAADRDTQTRVGNDEAVRLVNKLLAAAIDREATDIHIEPLTTKTLVRMRIDGQLVDWTEQLPATSARLISGRLKVLAGLDITERKNPQEGRIGLQAGTMKREVEIRVTTLPLRGGEKIALHISEAQAVVRGIDRVISDSRALDLVRRALMLPGGVIVVAGEHGSGTTSTLYALVGEKKRTSPGGHVIAVEDPVDQRVAGITQVGLNATLGFAGTLQAALKQDPDVVVAGDVRDATCATILLEAGLAGRTVLAALHADGAIAALERLVALGASRSKIGQAVTCVVSQRLARRLCTCSVAEAPPRALFEAMVQKGLLEPGRPPPVGRPVGCDVCHGSGVIGRIAVAEVVFFTEELRAAFALDKPRTEIEKAAGKAMVTFAQSSSSLLLQRVIAPAEALLISS